MNTLLAIFIVTAIGQGPIPTTPTVNRPAAHASMATPWDAVHAYLAEHATRIDSRTEDLLKAEAYSGTCTWTLVGCADRNSAPPVLDGPGLGWPAADRVVFFASDSEALIAASMILDITANPPPDSGDLDQD
ncbi:MAG: hypothetical protein H6534_07495 [Chthonomonadaceae bacterium]|nr:hypothetical protein [Chthonomonadaceae bacterium]